MLRRTGLSLLAMTAVALPASPSASAAQEAGGLVGERVRLSAPNLPGGAVVGQLLRVEDAAFVIGAGDPMGTGRVVEVPRELVTSVEVSTGAERGTGRGALLGAAFGAGTGAIFGALTFEEPSFVFSSRGESAAIGAVALGAIGLLVGGVAGFLNRTETWREIPVAGWSVSRQPDGRVGIGFRVAL